jgi:3,4-dihydroxy 2-butanone 4-phosphate synthase/GTP cyclohydrolase II
MILLSNRKKTIVGLDGYGLSVIGERPIPLRADQAPERARER